MGSNRTFVGSRCTGRSRSRIGSAATHAQQRHAGVGPHRIVEMSQPNRSDPAEIDIASDRSDR
eukprot:7894060-Pyramimonas_sp.AAC.1